MKIVNQDGNTVVTYTYDALGKITKQTDTTTYGIAKLNPFRYRGYVYDDETGLYYLQSRYYDPVTGRFINADVYCDTNTDIFGTNMFTYCNNDPVNQIDPKGTDAIWLQDSNAVYWMGHSSLLIEDALGVWWFTYWGNKYVAMYPFGNGTLSEFKSFINYGFDPRPKHNYYVKTYYDGMFENMLYLKGDFSMSLLLYSSAIWAQMGILKKDRYGRHTFYVSGNKLYNLAVNNCVQSCLDALNMGSFFMTDLLFKMNYRRLRNTIIPNAIYVELCILMPWSMIIYDDWYL